MEMKIVGFINRPPSQKGNRSYRWSLKIFRYHHQKKKLRLGIELETV